MKDFLEKYISFFFYIPLSLISISLCFENIYRGLTILILFTLWFLVTTYTKKYAYTLLFVFFLLPFNITLQIPESINLFNTTIVLYNPYVAGLWVNYLTPTLSILDIFVFIFFLQTLLYENKLFIKLFKNKSIVLLLLLLLVHILIVHNLLTTLLTLRISVYFFTAILTVQTLKDKKILKNMLQEGYLKILLPSTITLQGILGIYQFVQGSSLGISYLGESKVVNGMFGSSYIQVNGESFLRAYGTFPHPNVLAGWFILMFVISYLLYEKTKSKWYLLSLVLTIIFSIFTFSRISLLILLILSFFFLFKYLRGKKYHYSLSSLLWYRYLNIFNGEDGSLSDRITLLKINVETFKENLLLGTGLGNSIRYYTENIPLTQSGKLLLQPVHNIWFLIPLEFGLFLGMYFFFLLYKFFLKGIKLNTISLGILLTLFCIGMFDHYLITLPQGNIIFFSFLILLTDLG